MDASIRILLTEKPNVSSPSNNRCRMVEHPEAPIAGQKIVSCAWADDTHTLCTNQNLNTKTRRVR